VGDIHRELPKYLGPGRYPPLHILPTLTVVIEAILTTDFKGSLNPKRPRLSRATAAA
jgi:hypothetical protein